MRDETNRRLTRSMGFTRLTSLEQPLRRGGNVGQARLTILVPGKRREGGFQLTRMAARGMSVALGKTGD